MENKFSAIKVEAAYEISNGMTGMNRNVVLGICVLMNSKPRNIRSIFGMSKEHIIWKGHQYFVSQRKKCGQVLVAKFLSNENKRVKNTGSRVVWKRDGYSTFAVDTEMTQGVYGITIEKDGFFVEFGLAAKRTLRTLATSRLSNHYWGSCCITYDSIYCCGVQKIYRNFYPREGKVTLRAELDVDRHMLYFFVGDAQIPHSIVNVPSAVHFVVSGGYKDTTVGIKSFVKLHRPTADASVQCAEYTWTWM